ncbi:PEGA domain-containing protein [Halioxenophilus aromaticivorans]|uniref:PEGA domain-containing protein n=1 Tax=Halioxenophilus aromaticivorans TaxID=1306992 RepID=A0AAV3U5Y0_9ALTE
MNDMTTNEITAPAKQRRITAIGFTPTLASEASKGPKIQPLYIGVGVLLAVALAIVWFLVAARSVIVTATPVNAAISIEGGMSFRIGGNYLMLPGDYTLIARHEEYHPLTQDFTVTKQDVQTLTPSLTPLPGSLKIITRPAAQITAYLDNHVVAPEAVQLLDEKNTVIANISAGNHSYVFTFERFQDVRGSIDVEGRKQQQTLELELEPAWADITVATVPAGADIILDGQVIGQTPGTVEILSGDREIVLQKDGFKAKTYPLSIEPQKPQDLGELTLEKIDGLLKVTSTPSAAGVTVNGQYVGQTPLETAVTPGDQVSISLFKDGYQSSQQTVSLASGETRALQLNLAAEIGEISIKAKPNDALLYIDGRLSGRADQILKLPSKQHRVTIRKEGYADFNTTVLPRPGLTLSLAPSLKTTEQALWENIKPTITTAATDQTLKLFRPEVTFEMGSSRREQGRRANEAQRKIELTRAFYLAPLETTNEQFRRFRRSHTSSHVSGNSLDNDGNPVVNVSWQDAALFCNWLSEQEKLPAFYQVEGGKVTGFNPEATGYRLPTEAEWAWVARYQNGNMLKYSWGPTLPPPAKNENIGDRSAAALLGTIQASYDDGFAVTAPVGSMKPNHNGLYDISGNVAEWINDFYMIKTGLTQTAEVDPLGPLQGDYHVIRGASWANGGISDLRLSFRDYGQDAKNTLGFRIARYVQ